MLLFEGNFLYYVDNICLNLLFFSDVRRGQVDKLSTPTPLLHKYLQTQDLLTSEHNGVKDFFSKFFHSVFSGLKFALVCVIMFAIPTIIVITIISYGGGIQFSAVATIWFTAGYGAVLGITTPAPAIAAMTHAANIDPLDVQSNEVSEAEESNRNIHL